MAKKSTKEKTDKQKKVTKNPKAKEEPIVVEETVVSTVNQVTADAKINQDGTIETIENKIEYGAKDYGEEMAKKDDETFESAKELLEKVIDATIGKDIVGVEPSAEIDEIEIIPGNEDDSFQTVIHGEVHPHIPEHLLKKEDKEEKQKIKKEWLSPKRIYRWMGQIIDL